MRQAAVDALYTIMQETRLQKCLQIHIVILSINPEDSFYFQL